MLKDVKSLKIDAFIITSYYLIASCIIRFIGFSKYYINPINKIRDKTQLDNQKVDKLNVEKYILEYFSSFNILTFQFY